MTTDHDLVERTVDEVLQAHAAAERAQEQYRQVLREAIGVRGVQAELSRRLGRSREQLRQDAMTDEDRDRIRAADAERKRQLRERGRAS